MALKLWLLLALIVLLASATIVISLLWWVRLYEPPRPVDCAEWSSRCIAQASGDKADGIEA